MVDFNTKKNILQKLRKKRSENKLLWLPCVIAAAFVKLWYGTVCRIGMALSDKNGNFLGIRMPERKPKSRKARRQDDIVYVKKPFVGRVLSAVLAAAFVLMVAPELNIDLGIRASAAITATTTVDGVDYVYDPNSGGNDNYYRKDEFDSASARGIDSSLINFDVGYGATRVTWSLGSLDINLIDTVHIELVDTNSGRTLKEDDVSKDASEYVFTDIAPNTSVRVRLAPTTLIDRYKYTPANPDDPESKASITLEQRDGFAVDGQASMQNIGRLDATFDAPTLKILNKDSGLEIDDTSLIDCNNGKVMLQWEAVQQKGGAASDLNTPADGYVIYRYDVTNRSFAAPIDAGNTLEYAVNNVTPGVRYQYFIEAYRNVWGGSGYNQNSDGIISSSKGNIKSDPQTKMNIIYSNTFRNLYVAPAAPNLTINDGNPKAKAIGLTWSQAQGNYDGVEIYRSVGQIRPERIPEVANGTIAFSTWLQNNAESPMAGYEDFKITGVGKTDFEKAISSIEDSTNIAEGVQYYYYAIAYTRKDTQAKIYSTPTIRAAKLELKLSKTTLNIANTDGRVDVSWVAVDGADGYDLEITQRSQYDPITKTVVPLVPNQVINREIENGTSFAHTELYNGEQFTYRVRPYVWIETKDGTKPFYGEYCDPRNVTVGLGLETPENITADGSVDGQVTVSWSAVPGATGYTLYYKNKTTGETKTFKTTRTTYTQINLVNDHVCEYYVVAYKNVNVNGSDGVQTIESEASGIVTVRVGQELKTPQNIRLTSVDGQITVTWDAVQGAAGYLLYYKKNNEDFAKDPFDLSSTSFNHTGLINGDTYTYYVVAYKEVSGERVYGPESIRVSRKVGDVLDAPKDFTVTTTDGTVNMTWSAVQGAEGYIIHASSGGRYYQFDVSRTTYTHTDLTNGDVWTYYVTAYKTVNGSRTYSNPSESKTVTIGISLNSAVDLTATAGNRQIDLTWTAVNGADGYVVYLYNSKTMEFEPITVTSRTNYSHVGLKNGKQYTYMVAPYKNINGKRFYGDYSMSVTAIPTTGSITDMDHELIVKGTAPYGISHSEYITAVSNHGAFDESVDVYFSTSREATQEVRDVLKNYADGLSSFIIYPFDISIYRENTYIEVDPEDGYTVTITMPVPDRLIAYRDYITVVHIGDAVDDREQISLAGDWYNNYDQRLEVLPCAIVDIDNVWCVQFKCSSFSPYALVIYKEHIQDIAAGGGLLDDGFADTFNSGLLLFTALPDILPNNRKLKIVQSGSKRYRIKSVTKK